MLHVYRTECFDGDGTLQQTITLKAGDDIGAITEAKGARFMLTPTPSSFKLRRTRKRPRDEQVLYDSTQDAS